jgi:TonB family protein
MSTLLPTAYCLLFGLPLLSCMDQGTAQKAIESLGSGGPRPDEMPRMLNPTPPFRYPPLLFSQKVQGNVTLRIFIDTTGTVRPESTRVEEASGYAALDSAAIKGSEELLFRPAQLGGQPLAVSILLPVYFRHPAAPPLPGDTLLPPRARVPTPR